MELTVACMFVNGKSIEIYFSTTNKTENAHLRTRLWQGFVQTGLDLRKMWITLNANINGQNLKLGLALSKNIRV